MIVIIIMKERKNTSVQCIKLIKSDSKYIYIATIDFCYK